MMEPTKRWDTTNIVTFLKNMDKECPMNYAFLGRGFAGLLHHSQNERQICELFDNDAELRVERLH